MREYKYLERPLPKHIVKQIREDAIDELVSACKVKLKNDCIEFEDDITFLDISDIVEIAEQLKEQNNETN